MALVVAQLAGRIALSGSSYQGVSRLANPKIGWGFGWLTFCYPAIGVAAIANALASQAFMPLFGMEPDEGTARLITLAILLVQVVLVVASTRLVSLINSTAVGLELALILLVAPALAIVVVATGRGDIGNLTSRGVTEHTEHYFDVGGGLMVAMIMGLATLVGFDSAANLAEEAKDPFRSVPRAIVGSVVAAGVLGMAFLICLTVAIEDIPGVTASESPVAAIMREQLGPEMEKVLLAAIVIAFFGAGTVVMASCSRIVFAMARDGRFPAHQLMRRVNPRTQPFPKELPPRREGAPSACGGGARVGGVAVGERTGIGRRAGGGAPALPRDDPRMRLRRELRWGLWGLWVACLVFVLWFVWEVVALFLEAESW